MNFQEIAKSVRAEAQSLGMRVTMSKLNDAIALACYGKKYAAVVAAEKAGKLDSIASPPPHIAAAARRYRLDEHVFGLALHNGIEGHEPAGHAETVSWAMQWLQAQYEPELMRLKQSELLTLADRALVDRVLAWPEYAHAAALGFAEWVVAEGVLNVNGRSFSVAELLLGGSSRPAWNARQRAYLKALVDAPLRLYLVEEVVAGYHLDLRPIGAPESHLVRVAERSGSQPKMVGQMLGARVIAHNGRLVLAGGIYPFSMFAGTRLAESVRQTNGAATISRLIRSAWFEQFNPPKSEFVLAGEDGPMRFVTDSYRCPDFEALAARLADDPRVEGGVELGWSLVIQDGDDRGRWVCSIYTTDDADDVVSVFYQSTHRADTYRPWFEALAGDSVVFLERESIDPSEASMAIGDDNVPGEDLQLLPEAMTKLLAQQYELIYAGFADRPLPIFGGATPRQMLQHPDGEARVRELLATYESNERRMAQSGKREPASFGFLYSQLGLSQTPPKIESRSPGLHSDQFRANEAWIVFRLVGEPIETTDIGVVDVLGLIDAGSTCILNYTVRQVGIDLTATEAEAFFNDLKVPPPPHFPGRVLVAGDVESDLLLTEAARRAKSVTIIEPDSLNGIIGQAQESIGARLAAALRAR